MNKLIIIAFMLVILLNNVSALDDVLGGDIFTVTLVDQSPGTVPAIALEHNSQARVKLFFSVSSLAVSNVEYEITNVDFGLAQGSQYIRGIKKDSIAESIKNNLDYNDYFNIGKETIAVANVDLRRVGTGKYVLVTEETAKNICDGKDERTTELAEKIPDQIELKINAKVSFKACRGGFNRNEETKEIIDCPGGYLTRRDLYGEDTYFSEAQVKTEECIEIAKERFIRKEIKTQEDLDVAIESCGRYYTKSGQEITDNVETDVIIGVDKSNLDLLIDSEKLKDEICNVNEKREKIQNVIEKTEKAEDFFTSTCAIGVLGAAANYVIRGDACDSLDAISLGCDWIFCPNDVCDNQIDPFNSIIASTTACWDFQRHFFGKEIAFNLNKEQLDKLSVNAPLNPQIIDNGDGTYSTYDSSLIKSSDSYTNSVCVYPDKNNNDKVDDDEAPGSIEVPHYACVSGVRGNLEIIDLMYQNYQNCLIAARQGGQSIGYCDKLRSYYICDRVLGEAIGFFGATGPQKWISSALKKGTSTVFDSITTNDVDEYLDNRKQNAQVIAQQSISRYQNVPFIQLIGKRDQYLRNQFCYAFIEGRLFSLKDLKEQFELFKVDISDSALVNVEMRPWDYYNLKSVSDIEQETQINYESDEAKRSITNSKLLMAALITHESAGKWSSSATSPTGVKGIMQITTATAEQYCSSIGTASQVRGDNIKGIQCGVRIFSQYFDSTKNINTPNSEEKLKFALAAYNGGPGGVNKLYGYSGISTWNNIPSDHFTNTFGSSKGQEVMKYPNYVLDWYNKFTKCTFEGDKITGCPNDANQFKEEYNEFEDTIENAVVNNNLPNKLGDIGSDKLTQTFVEASSSVPEGCDAKTQGNSILVPAEYSYDVYYQIYSGEVDSRTGARGGAYSIFLKDLTSCLSGVSCPSTVQIASGIVQDGQLVQENIFKIHQCKAAQQCIQFKGKTVCRNINETLVYGSSSLYDPLGLTVFSEDDKDGDGISDSWELQYFGLKGLGNFDRGEDADGDTYCNAIEYLKGKDPTNPKNYPSDLDKDCSKAIAELDKRANKNLVEIEPTIEKEDGDSLETPEDEQGSELDNVDTGPKFKSIVLKDATGNVVQEAPIAEDLVYSANKAGKYTVVVTFETPRDLSSELYTCKVNNENGLLTKSLGVNTNICSKQVDLVGDRKNYKFTLNDVNGNVVYSKDFSIINNEPKASEENYLLCRFTQKADGDLWKAGQKYLYIVGPASPGKRCSEYELSSEPGTLGEYLRAGFNYNAAANYCFDEAESDQTLLLMNCGAHTRSVYPPTFSYIG